MARSKEFEINEVLERAISLFWEQGYEKTSMQDLVKHMGIHKRSMYDTFGDKHSLYIQALERCVNTTEDTLLNKSRDVSNVKSAIRSLLQTSLDYEDEQRKGCLIVNCATELALRDEEASEQVKHNFESTQDILLELIKQGQETGELDTRHNPQLLAMTVFNAWIGIRVQTRVVTDRNELEKMIDGIIELLG